MYVHIHENNAESQAILDENRTHFNRQCQTTFDLLMNGERITQMSGMLKHGICDIRRRIKDLKSKGVSISEQSIEGAHGMKEFFMTESDKRKNQAL